MKKLRILIVEDDVVARIALENILTEIASGRSDCQTLCGRRE